jgi:hypothetical protein
MGLLAPSPLRQHGSAVALDSVVMIVVFARRPIEFRWLALIFAFALPAEIVLTFAYSQSFG